VAEKKYSAEMYAEALREAGVLIIVFTPLYKIFEGSKAEWSDVISALLVGATFLLMGVDLERNRK
jgi:hypothetical protein